jgi:hypothetical protein
MRIVLLSLVVATTAWAQGLCGITARACRSAETRVLSRYIVPLRDWYTDQEWTPWSVSIDPGTRTIDLRFRYGGHDDNQGGIAYADSEERSVHHDILSCKGSVASGKIELDVGGERPVDLYFEKGVLVQVYDSTARATAGYDIAMHARPKHEQDPLMERNWTARNITFDCPGGGQSLFGVAPSSSGGSGAGAKKAKGGNSSATTASGSSAGGGYEKAPARTEPQSRQTDTGEQGGAGGASKVDFGPEVHQAAVQGCKESCRDSWKECHDSKHDEYMDCLKAQPYEADSYTICTRQAYGECEDERSSCNTKCESE